MATTSRIARAARPALTLLGVLALPVASAAAQPAQAKPASGSCPAVHLVTTAGTSESNPKDDPYAIAGFANGRNFTKAVADRYQNVTAWQTPYEASSGIVHSIGETRSTRFLPYAASKRQAVEAITGHLVGMKQRCPTTKYVLSGFSQGAEATGDVLESVVAGRGPVSSSDIAGVYLIADPKRAALTGTRATTSTGTRGQLTRAGATLIPIDRPLLGTATPSKRSEGVAGARADGLYQPLSGKVRQICYGPDAVCASHPNDPLARIARMENARTDIDPDYYQAVSLQSMLADGSAARALGPRAGAILHAITYANYPEITRHFRAAAKAPGLSNGQRASLRLLATELPELMQASGIRIDTKKITGNHDIDRLLALLKSAGDKRGGLGTFEGMIDFEPSHTAYFTGGMSTATIGGVPVDQWIEQDMGKVVRQHGARR